MGEADAVGRGSDGRSPPAADIDTTGGIICDDGQITPDGKEIYAGTLSPGVRVLKRISVISLFMAFSVTPLFAVASSQTATAAISVMTMAILLSSLSTYLVQWCCSPYILRILDVSPTSDPDAPLDPKKALRIETTTFFGFTKVHLIQPESLAPSNGQRLFGTWKTVTPPLKHFYIHPELAQGFTPEMGKLIEYVTGAEAAAAKRGVDRGAQKRLDDLVAGMRNSDEVKRKAARESIEG
ncbi:hypothetical protein HK101_010829 [Irineochytrium annulatum]|nr:hypothetical protein HK101_010829 [Irineochytrium annulatum]